MPLWSQVCVVRVFVVVRTLSLRRLGKLPWRYMHSRRPVCKAQVVQLGGSALAGRLLIGYDMMDWCFYVAAVKEATTEVCGTVL